MGRKPLQGEDENLYYPLGWATTLQTGIKFDVHEDFRSEEEMRAIWSIHKKDLMSDHMREYPLSRCWAWWKYEAKTERPAWPNAPLTLLQMGEFDQTEIALLEAEMDKSHSITLRNYGRRFFKDSLTPKMRQIANRHLKQDQLCYPKDTSI